jgi:hypothetical protein
MGLLGILVGLAILVWLAFRGWSVLLLAPAAALVAATFGGQPLLASWTQIFMESAARFLAHASVTWSARRMPRADGAMGTDARLLFCKARRVPFLDWRQSNI